MIVARTASVVADALVLAITWVKTWTFIREAPPVNFASKVTSVLMGDGAQLFIKRVTWLTLTTSNNLGTFYLMYVVTAICNR